MNLRPQAIGSPFCCFLTVAPLSVSLPAEEEARGYAENRIRYSNMCMRSPTSSCVFRGQPSPGFSSAGESDQLRKVLRHPWQKCVCVYWCVYVCAISYEPAWVTTYASLCAFHSLGDEVRRLGGSKHFFSPPTLPTVNNPSISAAKQQRVINKQAEGNTGDHAERQSDLMGKRF